MLLNVRVIPRASKNLVKQEAGSLKVYLTKPAEKGLANKQLIQMLAEYLGLKIYQVRIIKGFTCRDKLVQINE